VTTASTGQLPRLRALDGLRGVAVIGVVAFHAGYLPGGFLGVDLFFTLSGFLITSLLLIEIESTSAVDLKHFWSRRARRLLPAVIALVLFVPLYAQFWATPYELENLRADALATLAYVANWRQIAQGTDYWSHYNAPSPLQHTWSLAIEEQFYVLFPFLILLMIRLGVGSRSVGRTLAPAARRRAVENRLLVTAAVLTLLSVFVMVSGSFDPSTSRNTLYFSTITRFASILVGVALAALSGRLRSPTGTARVVLQGGAIAALVLLAVAWSLVDGESPFVYRGGLLVCAVAAAIVIFAIQQPATTPLHKGLSLRPLVWVGLVSYGLYLWHWPVFVVLDQERTGLDGVALLAVRLAVTMALVVPSYYLLENPIRRGRLVTSHQARIVLPLALVAVVGLVLVQTAKPIPDALTALRKANIPPGLTSSSGQPPRVLLVGDSVGNSLAKALTGQADVLGVDVRSLAKPGCGIWPEVTRIRWPDGSTAPDGAGCKELIASWPIEAKALQPAVAVVAIGFPGGLDREIDGAWEPFCGPRSRSLFEHHLGEAVDALHTQVARVVLTTASPVGAGPRHGDRVDDVDCVNGSYRAVAASRPWLTIVDLDAHICPEQRCLSSIDGNMLRPDGLHYAGPSAAIIGTWVIEQALQAATQPL
jgi:peptidoglycan/LPS O-acetylase OafA/YrhL